MGRLDGTVQDSYATGGVSALTHSYCGSLVGDMIIGSSILSSYSDASVSAGTSSTLGGLVGSAGNNVGRTLTDTYWDLETSGIGDPSQGVGTMANFPGVTGLTTAQFQSGLPTGFSSAVWGSSSAVNGGYPYLLALPPS
ncbi:MAG: hypothetical protein ACRDL7_14070 [Gaiellaceae bacterium]